MGEGSRGKELEFVFCWFISIERYVGLDVLVQGSRSCVRRRGVAKPWIALVERRTRVATDGVESMNKRRRVQNFTV